MSSELDSIERLLPDEREKRLSHQLAGLVRFAYKNIEPVRRKFDSASISPRDIRQVRDLEKVPITTKDELVQQQKATPPFGGYLSVPVNKLSRVYVSPGPIYDVYESHVIKALSRFMRTVGFVRAGDIVMITTSYHMVPAGLALTEAIDKLGVTVIPAGPGQTEMQIQVMRDLKVTGYMGFASFLMSLFRKAEEMGYDVRRDLSLRWALCSGERHFQDLRGVFEREYGIACATNYGTGDLGLVAYECPAKNGMHYNDRDALIEIVDPRTGKQCSAGQEGEVVVTLLNRVYPLVRFGTGDLAIYRDEPCACGRTNPRIMGITGMIGDHVRAKGMFIHAKELDEAMSSFPQITRYQMTINLKDFRDDIGLLVETNVPLEPGLAQSIRGRCKEKLRVSIDTVDSIPCNSLPPDAKKFLDQRWKS